MNQKYVEENTFQRQRLLALTDGLTEAQLHRDVGRGWTVADKLVHLAWWDRYCLALLSRWEREGVKSQPTEVDAVNEAVRALGSEIPAERIVELVRAAAEAIDRKVENVAAELETAIEGVGRVRLLRRSEHRREHLDQVEAALKNR